LGEKVIYFFLKFNICFKLKTLIFLMHNVYNGLTWDYSFILISFSLNLGKKKKKKKKKYIFILYGKKKKKKTKNILYYLKI